MMNLSTRKMRAMSIPFPCPALPPTKYSSTKPAVGFLNLHLSNDSSYQLITDVGWYDCRQLFRRAAPFSTKFICT